MHDGHLQSARPALGEAVAPSVRSGYCTAGDTIHYPLIEM
eukprot:COSAG02_NODE_53634_length_300_cov_1.203980_1_plen_39_part_01